MRIVIDAITTPNQWRLPEGPVSGELYADVPFEGASGNTILAGNYKNRDFYIPVTASVSGGILSLGAINCESTEDSPTNQLATYTMVIRPPKGRPIIFLPNFRIPTLGTGQLSFSWATLIIHKNGKIPRQTTDTYSKQQILDLVANAPNAALANIATYGRARFRTSPADSSDPVMLGPNDLATQIREGIARIYPNPDDPGIPVASGVNNYARTDNVGQVQMSVAPTVSAAVAATGQFHRDGTPLNGDTITVNGAVFTLKTTPAGANDIQISAVSATMLNNIVTALNASTDARVALATYSRVALDVVITYDVAGQAGNLFTTSAAGSGITASQSNLIGGLNANVPTAVETSDPRIGANAPLLITLTYVGDGSLIVAKNVKLDGSANAVLTGAGDTGGYVGTVVSGGTNTVTVAVGGKVAMTSEGGALVAGRYAQISGSQAGCITSVVGYPTSGQVLGRILVSGTSPIVDIFGSEVRVTVQSTLKSLTGWESAVVDGGLDPTGTSDNRVAFQAFLDAIVAANKDATICFPDGTYKWSTASSGRQITLPAMPTNQISIRLKGLVPPSSLNAASGPTGATLKSTLASGTGTMFGTTAVLSHLNLWLEDLAFEMPANPTNSCLDLRYIQRAFGRNLKLWTGEAGTPTVATTATSYALRTPMNNIVSDCGFDNNVIAGFYTGIEHNELASFRNTTVVSCVVGVEVPACFHSSRSSLILIDNITNVKFTGGISTVDLTVELEHAASGPYVTVTDISDASNFAHGTLRWFLILANSGVSQLLTQTGAFYLNTPNLYTDLSYPISPFVQGWRTTDQSFADDTVARILFNANLGNDQYAIHSTSANTDRFNGVKAALVQITCNIQFAANATGIRELRLYKFSGFDSTTTEIGRVSTNGNATKPSSLSLSFQGSSSFPGDYFFAQAYQNSGGALNLLTSGPSNVNSPLFTIVQIQ